MKNITLLAVFCLGVLFAASTCFAQQALFAPAVTYSSGGDQARSIAVGDVNGDGKLDVLVVNECGIDGSTCTNSTVGVLLGNGDATFQAAALYESGGVTAQATVRM